MFWANVEVLKPSIYAKPPVPVVVTKFKDRRPVPQAAAEMLERCCVVAFDLAHINELMLLVRDDVVLYSRGVPWCRYESGKDNKYYDYEKVCIDHKNRRDFLHSLSRNWREVTWVAAASYLTRAEARERFHKYSAATPTRTPSTRSTATPRRSAAPTSASAPSSGRSGARPSGAWSGSPRGARTFSTRTSRIWSSRGSFRAPSRPMRRCSRAR